LVLTAGATNEPADPLPSPPVRWLLAVIALVGLVQAVVWIGQPTAAPGRRLLGVFAAPIALVLFAVALAGTRVPDLF
jgi:hypothetical protein